MPTRPSKKLDVFANPKPGRRYVITHECPEYTAMCPVTGQPDFGTIIVTYTPDKLCVELKSLKLYIWSFRDRGAFHEAVTNEIANRLVALLTPRFLRLSAQFNMRGGIATTVVAEHRRPGWTAPPPVSLP